MSNLSPEEMQMRRARRELSADVFDMAEKARDMTDWKYYVRTNLWLCLGAAATLGYLSAGAVSYLRRGGTMFSRSLKECEANAQWIKGVLLRLSQVAPAPADRTSARSNY